MSEGNIFPFFINPLTFFKASDHPALGGPGELIADNVLDYLATDNRQIPLSEMKSNYQLVHNKVVNFPGLPAEAQILNKLIFPLRHSIGYFVIGNFLESIALSAFVGEMATIFKCQIYAVSVLDRPLLNEADEKENLIEVEQRSQSSRIKRLLKDKLIGPELACKLDIVRVKRNHYLHRITATDANIKESALTVIENTVDIVRAVTGLRMGPGKVLLDPKVMEYLKKKGLVT